LNRYNGLAGPALKLNNDWEGNWSPRLHLEFFPSGKRKSQFGYYTGNGVQRITARPEHDGLRIEFGDLGAPGTVEVYCQEVKGVTRNGVRLREGADYHSDKQSNKLTFSFQGASKIAIDGAGSLF